MDTTLSTEQMQELWNEEAKTKEADTESPDLAQDVPVEPPQPDPEPAPEPVPEDPFASLPEPVRAKLAELDSIKDSHTQLLQHVKTAEGRVAAMQREFEQAKRAQQSAPKEAPSQVAIADAKANPEKWEQLKSDFPEWAEAMEGYVSAKLSAINVPQGLTAEEVSNYVQQKIDGSKAETARLLQEARIEGKYEDWRDVVNTKDFAAWLGAQKPDVQNLAESESARDAIKMLDMFHEAKAKPADAIKQERNARLNAAASPVKGGVAPPPKSVDAMTDAELWEHEAKARERTRVQRGF